MNQTEDLSNPAVLLSSHHAADVSLTDLLEENKDRNVILGEFITRMYTQNTHTFDRKCLLLNDIGPPKV